MISRFPFKIGERSKTRTILAIQPRGQKWKRLLVRCDCGYESWIADTCFRVSGCSKCAKYGPDRKYGNRLAGETRLYKIWTEMRRRCRSREGWADKGITVCKEWDKSFEVFESWSLANGYGPKLTIDRIESLGNYEPKNCQWVTRQENSRRCRTTYKQTRIEALPGSGLLSFGC